MKRPRFSIITVCYNAEKFIGNTIQSVLVQSFNDFEYIIKDGCSTDNTVNIVHALCDGVDNVIFVQNRDQGIYDAMNIALEVAKGQYIFFLNAGDKFVDSNVLNKIRSFIDHHDADIFYGNVIEVDAQEKYLRRYSKKNSKRWYYSLGACLCHQGMFCDRKLFEEKRFDITYRVCADREWQLYHLNEGKIAIAMKITVAEILVDGFSSEHVIELEEETRKCIKLYCGRYYNIYRVINWIKKNKYIHLILQKVERKISSKY